MDKIYAQVINGIVNLIGGADVGLPHENTSDTVQVIDITRLVEKPKEGWFYVDGEFIECLPKPEPGPAPEPAETTEQKLAQLEEQNIILMDALATTFEEVLALRAIVEGGTS